MIRLGSRVAHVDADSKADLGTVMERYQGTKPAMKGMLRVEWDSGEWCWCEPSELTTTGSEPAPTPEAN